MCSFLPCVHIGCWYVHIQVTRPHKQHLQTLPAQVSDQQAQCMYEYTQYQITANETLQTMYREVITVESIILNVKCT